VVPVAAAPDQVRGALSLVADTGAAQAGQLAGSLSGSPEQIRAGLLEGVPAIVGYYSDGSSALAADWYDDIRADAAPSRAFVAEPVVLDRAEKFARAIVWAAEPLFLPEPSVDAVILRLQPVVQKEVARPFRDTITTNSERDPASVGWRRVASGSGCKFCRMLSDRGAVYKASTARFAAHTSCHCGAAPVFEGQDGEEASVLQYVASQRRPSAKDRQRLRDYLAQMD